MSGASNKNILMFQKLVGKSVLDHVICCTTMWDREEEPMGEFTRRENELETTYWANMLAGGAQMTRHNNTAQSARSIIAKLVYKKPVVLKIQRELVDEKKSLSETSAGVEVNKELARKAERDQKELEETKEAFERMRAEDNVKMAKLLADERAQLERKLQEAEMARAKLDADRQADLKRLEDRIAAARARENEARRNHERQIENIHVENQRASFGLALQILYEPSNSLHEGRPIHTDGEGQKIRGSWSGLVAKMSWPPAN
jgi:septal ring factor EnvC (AmiA/AmiB activator)